MPHSTQRGNDSETNSASNRQKPKVNMIIYSRPSSYRNLCPVVKTSTITILDISFLLFNCGLVLFASYFIRQDHDLTLFLKIPYIAESNCREHTLASFLGSFGR